MGQQEQDRARQATEVRMNSAIGANGRTGKGSRPQLYFGGDLDE